ncbi:hypothetical protein AAF712_001171 [Marasmius tenuissimus]|uniref:CxC2-like cysteine cluster KDZ transposase-associated domain-containing protein n=1 Tax=Marasmius tenuissimus TaxID=585030 RepID=A0ABR3ACR1_9AGAR
MIPYSMYRKQLNKEKRAAFNDSVHVATPPPKRLRVQEFIDERGTSRVVIPISSSEPQPNPGPSRQEIQRLPAPEKSQKGIEDVEMKDIEKGDDAKAENRERIPVEKLVQEEKTRRLQLLGDWEEKMDQAVRLSFKREAHDNVIKTCSCGGATRKVRCYECLSLPLLCERCWVAAHKHNPLHWAHVWCEDGFFVKYDISALELPTVSSPSLNHDGNVCPKTKAPSIPLGHDGNVCPKAKASHSLIVTDFNGVHSTRVIYCDCKQGGHRDKWTQLYMNDLLPSTVLKPQSCFTFRLMHQFHLLRVQTTVNPFDYIKTLRRMSNNVFTGDVPDLYKQFMNATRVWDFLQDERRAGVHHELWKYLKLSQRPANDLIVECPSCPHPRVNTEEGWEKTPPDLMHLHMTRLTLDGNYHANHYAKKNLDPNDVSIYSGRSYFPIASVYNEHCGFKEPTSTEKSVCGHLNTISKQNKVKFKNMDISGIVNCQCCHVFIRTSANLKCAERWVCVDDCLARAVAQTASPNGEEQSGPFVVSYDAMCSYCKYIIDRWIETHPEYVYLAGQMLWVIPVCHCRNHIASCEPLYLYVYKSGVGLFKGETAEQPWDTINRWGASTRQMNLGLREDVLILVFGDWNWRKTVGLALLLYNEILSLRSQYSKKRDSLIGLWLLHPEKALEWNAADRSPKVDPKRKRSVKSVYMHDENDKAPTLKSIVDAMKASREDFETPSGRQMLGVAATYLDEGLAIAFIQEHLRRLVDKHDKSKVPDPAVEKEIRIRRTKCEARITSFRKTQVDLMTPDAASHYRNSPPCHPENQLLWTPVDFTPQQRLDYGLTKLATEQAKLIQGKLYDIIRALQTSVKRLTQAFDRKNKTGSGVDHNTRALAQIVDLQHDREKFLLDYRFLRGMLDQLGALDVEEWPQLKTEDTYRKSTEARRIPGASHIEEGALWGKVGVGNSQAASKRSEQVESRDSDEPTNDGPRLYGTRMSVARSRNPSRENHLCDFFPRHANERADQSKKSGSGSGKPVAKPATSSHSGDTGGQATNHPAVKGDSLTDSPQKQPFQELEETEIDLQEQRADGWIWTRGKMAEMNTTDVQKWSEKEDKLQFHRTDAEYERVQEELEFKHACFHRAIRFFAKKSTLWEEAASNSDSPGKAAYAKEKAAMYDALRADCQYKLELCGMEEFVNIPEGKTLADQVKEWRVKENKLFPRDRLKNRPAFVDPTIHSKGFKDTREGVETYCGFPFAVVIFLADFSHQNPVHSLSVTFAPSHCCSQRLPQ